MEKQYQCVVCSKKFIVQGQKYNGFFKPGCSPFNVKTCSPECRKERQLKAARDQAQRKKLIKVTRPCRFCGKEVVSNAYCPRSFCGGGSGTCYREWLSKSRKGTKNPAYRNGMRSNGKRSYNSKHLRACAKYKKEFLSKNDYLFCEVCGVNENGTPRFETHHIYFASLYPKHKELHNHKNLILLCIGCHNKFHSADKEYKKKFIQLEKTRGLKKLFES